MDKAEAVRSFGDEEGDTRGQVHAVGDHKRAPAPDPVLLDTSSLPWGKAVSRTAVPPCGDI